MSEASRNGPSIWSVRGLATAGQWLPPALVVDEVLVREVEGEGDVLVVAVLLVSLVHLLQHRVTVAKSSDGQEQREEE